MGPGVWWSESCSVGLVWSGDHGFSSFPCVVFFFLAVFCFKNRGYDDRSMRSTCPVVGLILLPFVDWILAKTRFAKHLGQCFWLFGGLDFLGVGLVWCGDHRFCAFPCLAFAFFGCRILRFQALGIQILDFKPDKLHPVVFRQFAILGTCVPQKFRVRTSVCILFCSILILSHLSLCFTPDRCSQVCTGLLTNSICCPIGVGKC